MDQEKYVISKFYPNWLRIDQPKRHNTNKVNSFSIIPKPVLLDALRIRKLFDGMPSLPTYTHPTLISFSKPPFIIERIKYLKNEL